MAPQPWHPSKWHLAMACMVAPSNAWWHAAMALQQWHPAMACMVAPSNGALAMAPSNGIQRWHPAMAPSNGTQREPRQSWCLPPPIGSKNPHS